jgi:hypothetical protein
VRGAVQRGRDRAVGDREVVEHRPVARDQAVEDLERRRDLDCDLARGVTVTGLRMEPASRDVAERDPLVREECGAQHQRHAIEELVDPRCVSGRGTVEIVPALAAREEAQDRVRLGQDELLVDERRDLADRIQLEVRGGSRLLRGYQLLPVRQRQLLEQEADLERVRRAREAIDGEHRRKLAPTNEP